jgi:hypothetical protein
MIVIGIDVTALDPAANSDVGSLRLEVSIAEYQRLIVCAKAWHLNPRGRSRTPTRRHLALWLLALGDVVLDFPTTATVRFPGTPSGRRKLPHRRRHSGECRSAARRCPSGLPADRRRPSRAPRRTSSQSVTQHNSVSDNRLFRHRRPPGGHSYRSFPSVVGPPGVSRAN